MIRQLPEKYKIYTLKLSSGDELEVKGELKEKIFMSQAQFVELPDGNIINKSFIVSFLLDIEKTKEKFLKLPKKEREKIISQLAKL